MDNDAKGIAGQAISRLRRYWFVAAGFSLAINLLLLVSPLYMLQIYDRVLTSGSRETLTVLTLLAMSLLALYAAAEGGRRRVLALAGRRLGDDLGRDVFRGGAHADGGSATLEKSVSDLSRVQGFLITGQVQPLFDVPFVPLFLGATFLIHPLIGTLSLVGALVLLGVAVVTERTSRKALLVANANELAANAFLSGIARQFSAIIGMGMHSRVEDRWQALRVRGVSGTVGAVNRSAFLAAGAKSIRQMLQVAVLGLGAWLALRQQVSAGAIVAGSILMGRALAPIDQAVGLWPHIVSVRSAWQGLTTHLGAAAPHPDAMVALPRPAANLAVEALDVGLATAETPVISNLSLRIMPGAVLGIVGQSGGGKTSLLQTLSGAWPPRGGRVLLDGRSVHAWRAEDRGQHVGYLPQRVDLLPGTIFDNIARFGAAEPDAVFAAARAAGCHEMILGLADGYDAVIQTEGGTYLSAGQMQLVGLARAVFGQPAIVFLDEPSANLDARSVGAVARLLQSLKRANAAVLVATHDPRVIQSADHVLELGGGRGRASSRADYMQRQSGKPGAHLRPVGGTTP